MSEVLGLERLLRGCSDAYLRHPPLDGLPYRASQMGQVNFLATPWDVGALVAWIPQAFLYGSRQSHLEVHESLGERGGREYASVVEPLTQRA